MPEQTFQLRGQIINQTTREGLPNLRVEAWDRDNTDNDLLGQALTDPAGSFFIYFNDTKFNDGGTDPLPDPFVKGFAGKRAIYSSQAQPIKDWEANNRPLVIEIKPQMPTVEPELYVAGEV